MWHITSRQYVKYLLHSEFYFRTVPNIITVILGRVNIPEIFITNSRDHILMFNFPRLLILVDSNQNVLYCASVVANLRGFGLDFELSVFWGILYFEIHLDPKCGFH